MQLKRWYINCNVQLYCSKRSYIKYYNYTSYASINMCNQSCEQQTCTSCKIQLISKQSWCNIYKYNCELHVIAYLFLTVRLNSNCWESLLVCVSPRNAQWMESLLLIISCDLIFKDLPLILSMGWNGVQCFIVCQVVNCMYGSMCHNLCADILLPVNKNIANLGNEIWLMVSLTMWCSMALFGDTKFGSLKL